MAVPGQHCGVGQERPRLGEVLGDERPDVVEGGPVAAERRGELDHTGGWSGGAVGLVPNTFGDSHSRARPLPGDMSTDDAVHENSWSVNLETPEYADDPELVVADALEAVANTAPGHHVNLVTHGELGHPEGYLYPELAAALEDATWEYVEQCGCGGHVTRVHV